MKLSDIARHIGGTLKGEDIAISSIKSLDTAGSDDLTLLMDKHYLSHAQKTQAGAIVTYTEDVVPVNRIVVRNVRAILPELLTLFEVKQQRKGISKTARISQSASIGKNVFIGDYVTVGENTNISDDVHIGSGTTIGSEVTIGQQTILYANVSIYDRTQIGEGCILHSGSVIGADGFGFEKDKNKHWRKIPQLARVIIEDNVEIGANSCIDRGAIQDTVIGEGTKIDNLVQIGHNCRIGKHNVISAATAVAGSTVVGDYCSWGGQVGTAGHLHIGDNVTMMGRSGITKDIPSGQTIQGFPAKNFKESWKEQAFLQRWIKGQMKKEDKNEK